MAGYHQFHAVNVAVGETLRAARARKSLSVLQRQRGRYEAGTKPGGKPGDRRVGVVWHTQGSGKSLTMAFYAGRVIREPAMENPTIVVLTDRNDLDDQLFGTFSRCQELLRQPPVQAESRADLREKLVGRGRRRGVHHDPEVLPGGEGRPAPGALRAAQHRGDRRRGAPQPVRLHRWLRAPHARRAAQRLVHRLHRHADRADGHEHPRGVRRLHQRLRHPAGGRGRGDGADLLREPPGEAGAGRAERPKIDPDFEEATEGEEVERKEKLKTKWAQLEAIVGAEKRLKLIAQDIVDHFEKRLEAMDGKAMIVCMSRRICVELYREIVALRPDWHHDDDDKGSDQGRDDRLGLRPAGLAAAHPQQAAARGAGQAVPRPEGPVQDRDRARHVAHRLRRAVPAHDVHGQADARPRADAGHRARQPRLQGQARRAGGGLPGPRARAEAGAGHLHGERRHGQDRDRSGGGRRRDAGEVRGLLRPVPRLRLVEVGYREHRRSGWASCLPRRSTSSRRRRQGPAPARRAELSQAFALAVPHEEALRIRDDVAFFQAVRAVLAKRAPGEARTEEELDHAVRQIVSRAVASEGVVDIFAAAGLKKPDISILSDEFLAEVRGMPQRNLAVELLRKLLAGEIQTRRRKNVVQARSFAEMLEQAIRRYQNRAIEAAQVIEELIALAKEMREANARGEALGLDRGRTGVLRRAGNQRQRREGARRRDAADHRPRAGGDRARQRDHRLDVRENVRAQLRVLVKRILRKYGYPPDKQEKATQTVLEQAEVLSEEWATA